MRSSLTLYGDSDFGTALKLPYWDYLDVRHVNDSEVEFFRTGSLLTLASMALEPYEELVTYYLIDKEKAELFMNGITSFEPNELADGHEGGQLAIFFKLVGTEYKFAGFETIP